MNKVVLITGVYGGIGYATAKLFSKNNWTVVGIDKNKKDDADKVIDLFLNCDVSQSDNVRDIFKTIKQKYGKLDCLVNNAAIQICKSIVNTTEKEWDKTYASNIKSIFLTVKNAYDLLKETNGSIVNISSVHSMATSKGISAYASSKGAILAFTRSIALEFSEDNIRVNAVLPGAVNTKMLKAGLSRENMDGDDLQERLENLGLKHPSKRIGEPEEIAKAIYFLADNNQSSFITGQPLIVDGGALAQLSTEK